MSKESYLNHLGYHGSIEPDLQTDELFGQILFINDAIFYQGKTISELKQCFKEALEEYLETCKEIGKQPDKPCSGSFNVRITPELHKMVAIKSRLQEQSLNQGVFSALEEWVQEDTTIYHKHTVSLRIDELAFIENEEYSISNTDGLNSFSEVH